MTYALAPTLLGPVFRCPDQQIEPIAQDHQQDDRKMRRRLRIHAGNGFVLPADQDFILGSAAQSPDQAVELAAAQQRVQTWRDHTRTAAAQLEFVFVLAE